MIFDLPQGCQIDKKGSKVRQHGRTYLSVGEFRSAARKAQLDTQWIPLN